eukprot:731267-Karenia_brevis.AAC.1
MMERRGNHLSNVWGYCFPGDEVGYRWTLLVGKERQIKMMMATTVPHKGGRGGFAVDKLLDFIDENGDSHNNIL